MWIGLAVISMVSCQKMQETGDQVVGQQQDIQPSRPAAVPAPQPAARTIQLPQLPFDIQKLPLVDEVDLGAADPGHQFKIYPDSKIMERTEIFGKSCLTLPNKPDSPDRYVAVRIGEGKGLKAGVQYVLQIEYPEDAPRSMAIWNAGNETRRGFHTGASVGDALKMPYVFGNPESLAYPLSGQYRTWTCVFELHPHYGGIGIEKRSLAPENGFDVVLSHYKYANDPVSQGIAVKSIRLYAILDPKVLELSLKHPPAGLPQRHLFWREEMSDGVAADEKNPAFERARMTDWYAAKMRLMKFLGMDTFSKDLLEFGHNQGWDSSKYGSNDWVYQTNFPQLWNQLVELAGKNSLNILPMYEYCGSNGGKLALGSQRRCETLAQARKGPKGRDDYTHINWSEKANADVTDPDTVEDLRKMLEITIADESKKAHFLGAWIRPRNSGMPISFSDRCRKLFAEQSKLPKVPSRDDLKKDKKLYQDYISWWLGQRRNFFIAIRDYLRKPEVAGPEAVLIFTGDPTEPGRVISDGRIVTDDPSRFPGEKTFSPEEVLSRRLGWAGLTGEQGTWGGWEWQHSIPRLDPDLYSKTPGVMLSMAFNRQYSVSDAKAMESFRTPDGLAMIRHYPLNENCFGEGKSRPLGYFVCDFEEAGSLSMLAEARALANGDPRFIGYMTANSFQRGFPEYVRAFNQAFLALPALPSKLVAEASSNPQVVVREIPTPKDGTWYAIINTGMTDAMEVKINLKTDNLENYLTGEKVKKDQAVSLYPGQVLVWHSAK